MSCVTSYRNQRRLASYRNERARANRPFLTAATRKHTAFIEVDLPIGMTFTDAEAAVIDWLFHEHRTRGRSHVTAVYAYCQHLRLDGLDVVLRRIEHILAAKEQAAPPEAKGQVPL